MGSPSLDLAGTGLESLAGLSGGDFSRVSSGSDGAGSLGGAFGILCAPGAVSAGTAAAVGAATAGVDDAGGDVLMPDDPWEHMFGPAARQL